MVAHDVGTFVRRLAAGTHLEFGVPFEELPGVEHPDDWRADFARLVAWAAGRGLTPFEDTQATCDERITAWVDQAAPW